MDSYDLWVDFINTKYLPFECEPKECMAMGYCKGPEGSTDDSGLYAIVSLAMEEFARKHRLVESDRRPQYLMTFDGKCLSSGHVALYRLYVKEEDYAISPAPSR